MLQMMAEGGIGAWIVLLLLLGSVAMAILYAILPTRWAKALAIGSLIVTLSSGALFTLFAIARVFGAVAGVDPSMKAAMMAHGIAEALNVSIIAWSTPLLWAVPFTLGLARPPR